MKTELKKINVTSKQLDKMAVDYLATRYIGDYVKKRMKTKSYPHDWDVIMQSFKAGFYTAISKRLKATGK